MANRVSQEIAEVGGPSTGAAARVSQVSAEVASAVSTITNAHVSQVVAETGAGAVAKARVSQVCLEYATFLPGPRVTQLVAEAGEGAPAGGRLSQLAMEVATNYPITAHVRASQVVLEPGVSNGGRRGLVSQLLAEGGLSGTRNARVSQICLEYSQPLHPAPIFYVSQLVFEVASHSIVPGGITRQCPSPVTMTVRCPAPDTTTQTYVAQATYTTNFPPYRVG